ncbi:MULTISPECIES: hypothetical protein [Clostridium]|uniref:hypothetical protein n=1 Tax=Clostridium TaxID=1485 RepID=UPI00082616D8|nr:MULTISPECIES: hypothetical protein [Clostridium]PJI10010.1 helix-turn-helix domain-containing protein [Clostridium sp. CT7]
MKGEILCMYFDKKMSISSIAKKSCKSRTSIYSILKLDSRYKLEKEQRDCNKSIQIKEREKMIKYYFYVEKLKVIEISNKLQISNSLVTKIIKNDENYDKEKERRKKVNAKINREKSKLASKKRRSKINADDMEILIMLQRQNSIAMSKRNKLSNRDMVLANINHYRYNSKNKKLEFVASSGAKPNDLPGSIKI